MRRAILLQLIEPLPLKTFPVLPRWFAAATARARRPPLRQAIWIAEPRPDVRYGGSWWRSAGCAKPYFALPQGPLRSGFVGPKRPTTGTPSAAARCMGPVSPPIKSPARRVSSDKLRDGAGNRFRGAAAGFRNLLRQRLLAGAEIYQRANADFSKPSSHFRERRRGPALCSPACAGVQDAETRCTGVPNTRRSCACWGGAPSQQLLAPLRRAGVAGKQRRTILKRNAGHGGYERKTLLRYVAARNRYPMPVKNCGGGLSRVVFAPAFSRAAEARNQG